MPGPTFIAANGGRIFTNAEDTTIAGGEFFSSGKDEETGRPSELFEGAKRTLTIDLNEAAPIFAAKVGNIAIPEPVHERQDDGCVGSSTAESVAQSNVYTMAMLNAGVHSEPESKTHDHFKNLGQGNRLGG